MDGVIGRGTVLSGRYELTDPRPCDLPGTSEWRATDQILGRPVVVRVFPAGGAGPALDAARRAALVADPRLVRVLDVASDEDAGYVITELVPGPTLALLVAREPLSADQARAIVGEAAAALEVARRRGVHHLALRPSALAVSDDGRVLVSGIALDAVLLGRPAGDARTTSRTDAADLVRLAYAALTGHWPGPAQTADGLPIAPAVDGAPVPPADLVAGVPGDLNSLCAVTLGRADDGPLSPADLVRELEPWGEIRVQPKPTPLFPPVVADSLRPVTEPGQVVRQSVRSAFTGTGIAATRPGTPPPAPASRNAITPAMGVPFALAAGLSTPPVDPTASGDGAPFGWSRPEPGDGPLPGASEAVPGPVPGAGAIPSRPPAGASSIPPVRRPAAALGTPPPGEAGAAMPPSVEPPPPSDPDPFDFGSPDDRPPRRTGMGIAIAIVALLVVVAIAFAAKALFSGNKATLDPGAAAHTGQHSPTGAATSQQPSPTASSTTTTTTPTAPPVISSITSIDPTGGTGDHQELVGRAFDGDPSTYWMSMTYKRNDFAGFKPALGLQLQLARTATVHTVTLHVNGTGGNVEIRTGDATQPTAGTPLASGPMSPDAAFTLDPAQTTSSLVIWFTQLPTTADGSFRIELSEIQLG